MMNTTYETYMNALKQGLASFDSAAAEEILNDFESHFADARSQGLSDEEICAELGNVDDVLEFFRQEYATTKQPVANVLPQEKTHSNSEETHPNYRTPLPPPSPLWKSPCGMLLPTLLRALPLRLSSTFPATSIRTASRQALRAIRSVCERKNSSLPYSGNIFSAIITRKRCSPSRCRPPYRS